MDSKQAGRFAHVKLGKLLTQVAEGSVWARKEYHATDEFPSDQEWADWFEELLEWFLARFPGNWRRMLSRLRTQPHERDEAFAEIIAARLIEREFAYHIAEWEPQRADFLFDLSGTQVLAEVKAPGWRGQLMLTTNAEAAARPKNASPLNKSAKERVRRPKYLPGGEAGVYDHRQMLSVEIEKACFDERVNWKLPANRRTIVVLVSDTHVNMDEDFTTARALYKSTQESEALFESRTYDRLGGLVTVHKDWLIAPQMYPTPFHFYPNPNARPGYALDVAAFAACRIDPQNDSSWRASRSTLSPIKRRLK